MSSVNRLKYDPVAVAEAPEAQAGKAARAAHWLASCGFANKLIVSAGLKTPDAAVLADHKRVLNDLPGAPPFARIIEVMTPTLTQYLSTLDDFTQTLHKNNKADFEKAVEATITMALANIVRHAQKHGARDFREVVLHVTKQTEANYDQLHKKIELVEEDEKEQAEVKPTLKKVFDPLINMAFPNGQADLGLVLRQPGHGIVWNIINNVVPFPAIYYMLMESHTEVAEQCQALSKTESGQTVLSTAKFLAEMITNLLRNECKKPKNARNESTSTLVTSIAELAFSILKPKGQQEDAKENAALGQIEALHKPLTASIAGVISAAAISNDQENIWDFVKGRLEPLLIKAVFNLASDHGHLSNDPLTTCATKLRTIFTDFYMKPGVSDRLRQIRNEGDEKEQAEQEKALFAEAFQPLAKSLFEQTGLKNERRLKKLGLDNTIAKELPGFLYVFYKHIADTQPGIVDWIDPNAQNVVQQKQLENRPGGPAILAIADWASHQIMDTLPSLFDEKLSATISEQALTKVAELFPELVRHPQALKGIQAFLTVTISEAVDKRKIYLEKLKKDSSDFATETIGELNKLSNTKFANENGAVKSKLDAWLKEKVQLWLLANAEGTQATSADAFAAEVMEEINRLSPKFQQEDAANIEKFQTWFAAHLQQIAAENRDEEPLWQFGAQQLKNIIASCLAHIAIEPAEFFAERFFAGITGEQVQSESSEYAVAKIAECAAAAKAFFNDLPSDQSDRLEQITTELALIGVDLPENAEQLDELTDIFQPLASHLSDLLGIDKQSKLSAFGISNLIKTLGAKELAKGYIKMSQPQRGKSTTMDKLCSLLFDQARYDLDPSQQQAAGALLDEMDSDRARWVASGAVEKAVQIQAVTDGIASPLLITAIQAYLQTPAAVEKINQLLKLDPTNPDHQKSLEWLQQVIAKLATAGEGNQGKEAIWGYVEGVLGATLPKLLVNIIGSLEEHLPIVDDQHPLSPLPTTLITRIASLLDAHLKSIGVDGIGRETLFKRTKMANDIEDPVERQEALRAIYMPFVEDLLKLAGSQDIEGDPTHPLHDLSIPASIKMDAWNSIIPNVLADLLAVSYEGIQVDESIREELPAIFEPGSDHPKDYKYVTELGRMIGLFTEAYVPHMLAHDKALASSLVDSLKNAMEQASPDEQSGEDIDSAKLLRQKFRQFLEENNPEIAAWLTENENALGNSDDPAIQKVWSFLQGYVEPFAVNMIGGLAKTVSQIEEQGNSHAFLMDLTAKSMQLVAAHVNKVNEVTAVCRKIHPYEVPMEAMVAGFGELHLHPALLPPEKDMTPEQMRMEKFIKPLAKKLLKLANLTAENAPFPAPIRAQMFEVVETQIAPKIIETLYNKLGSKASLQKMQIALIKNLQASVNKLIEPSQQPPAPPTDAPDAATAQKFSEIGGPLLAQVVKWMPNTFTKLLIEGVRSVSELSADMLGNAAAGQIEQRTMIEMLKLALEQGITSMHPGEFDENLDFQPLDGIYNFTLDDEVDEKTKTQEMKKIASEAAAASRKLYNDAIWAALKSTLESFSDKIDKGVGSAILGIIIKALICIIAGIPAILIYGLIARPIQEIIVWAQVKNVTRDVGHPINENLIMQLVDLWVDGALAAKEKVDEDKGTWKAFEEADLENHRWVRLAKETVAAFNPENAVKVEKA